MPFSGFVEAWLQDEKIKCRKSYLRVLRWMLNTHLLPAFGEIPLDLIDRIQVLSFRRQLALRGLDPATVNRIIGALRRVLAEAELRFGLPNAARAIPNLRSMRKLIQPFTLPQSQALIDNVRDDYRAYLVLRLFAGLRSAEINGLRWDRVDLERAELVVDQTITSGVVDVPKSNSSIRVVRLSRVLIEALRHHAIRFHGSACPVDGLVFQTRNGTAIDNCNFDRHVWRPLLKRLGFGDRRPYQMRHTCATLWLAAGENPEWIARQLGHASTEMLFRVYSRYVPNVTHDDGSAFDRLLNRTTLGASPSGPSRCFSHPKPTLEQLP